jgi:UDP-N-acetylmuramate dehydrogenase
MNIQEYVDIKNYSTLHIGGQFRYFTVITSVPELISVCEMAKKEGKKIFILGGGSNIVFSDGLLDVFALKMEIKGFEIIKDTDIYTEIKIGAGEIWDKIVEKTIEMNLSGLEALSAIPGTVGATPVQNVGAYGAEVKDTITEVEVFDTNDNKIKSLTNEDCKFGYRDSIFKNEEKGKYVVISVIFRLLKLGTKLPDYPGVKRYFIENNINIPTLKNIRTAIIYIRSQKLPDTRVVPNVGSFFKNPIVSKQISEPILKKFPKAKFFKMDNNLVKIPAGWLIENAGLKGKSFGNVSVYDKNAIVLVNNGSATKEDVMTAKNEITKIVEEKFGITLEQEPEII